MEELWPTVEGRGEWKGGLMGYAGVEPTGLAFGST